MKVSKKEMYAALNEGIKNGTIEKQIINGETIYKLTHIGIKVSDHIQSDISQRN